MKIVFYIVLVILVVLAVASGITKIMLMEQEVEFFGQYGFSNLLLRSFGFVQLVGGALLAIPKTRIPGAIIVAVTFLVSAVLLVMANSIAMAVVTLVFVFLLGFIIMNSKKFITGNH